MHSQSLLFKKKYRQICFGICTSFVNTDFFIKMSRFVMLSSSRLLFEGEALCFKSPAGRACLPHTVCILVLGHLCHLQRCVRESHDLRLDESRGDLQLARAATACDFASLPPPPGLKRKKWSPKKKSAADRFLHFPPTACAV